MQGDDSSMARIEAPERRVQELAVGKRTRVVGHAEGVDRRELDLDRAPPTASTEIETCVDDQSMQPGVEAIRITKPGQIAPGTDQALLDRILGQVGVAKDQPRGCVQPPKSAIDEHGKGVMIASPRPLDELSLIHDRLACGTT
jgi:hypothetical protein